MCAYHKRHINYASVFPTATFIRLHAPAAINLNKPQGGSATIVTSSNPTTQIQSKPTVTVPVSTSSSMSSKTVTLTASKSVSLSSLPSTLKVVPGFLGQSGTCTLRILSPNPVQDTGITNTASSPVLSQSDFTLKHGSSTLLNKDSTKSETTVSVSSLSTEGPIGQVHKQSELDPVKQNSCDVSKRIAGNVSESVSSAATYPKSRQFSGDDSAPSHNEHGALKHLSLAEADNRDNPNVKETDFDKTPDPEEEEIDSDGTELTDDSDLYSDDDREDTCSFSVRASYN